MTKPMDEATNNQLRHLQNIVDCLVEILSWYFENQGKANIQQSNDYSDLYFLYDAAASELDEKIDLPLFALPVSDLKMAGKQLHYSDWTNEGVIRQLLNLSGAIDELFRANKRAENPSRKIDLAKIQQRVSGLANSTRPDESNIITHKSESLFVNWESVGIFFEDENKVQIRRDNEFIENTSYDRMGFANKKTGQPVKSWGLLYALAIKGNRVSVAELMNGQDDSQRNNLAQTKKDLTKRLKKYFGVTDDPFLDYGDDDAYTLRCEIQSQDNPVHTQHELDEINALREELIAR